MTRSIRAVLTVGVVCLVAVPWSARPAAAIANGENAREGSYRFSVLLTVTGLPAEGGGTRDSSCSGALIAPRWVITAGHCFRDAAGRRVSRTVGERTVATVGRTDLRGKKGHEVEVVDVEQAEGADVALAELGEAVTDITPIRVATEPPRPGEVLRLTGFGLATAGGAPVTRLQTGQFTVDAYGGALVEVSGHAPRTDTSPCPHDSGGPYFRERPLSLAAVVSSGPRCPHSGPDLAARTDNLSGWITTTTAPKRPAVWIAGAAVAAALTLTLSVALLRRRILDR